MIKNILIRADSSSIIGTGHIMRDLVLATQYKNTNIVFAVQNLAGNINHKIKELDYKLIILNSNSFEELNFIIQKYQIDMLVIDHYEINYIFEKKLKDCNKTMKILSLDDTYKKHYCDILLNHNINGNKKQYKKLVPKNCEIRCGTKYTLLREEFIIERQKKRIFIAMGGSDHSNINIRVLKVLENFTNIKVNLVTTTSNQQLKELEKYCKPKKWINLYINSNHIARLMRKSDFAIVTPSVTVNEVYFMKLPFIAIKTADNQKEIYKYLKGKVFLTLKRFNKKELQKKLFQGLYNE